MNSITFHQTPSGPRWAVGGLGFISPDGMPGFGGEPLRSTLISMTERDAPLHDDMLPDRIPAMRRQLFAGTVMPVARAAIEEARKAKSETLAADARQREPVLTVDPVLAVEMRAAVRAMDPSGQAAWIETAGLEGLTVTAADGNPSNLPEPIYERARERFWLENWISRYNAESGHPAQPDVDTVLATGPDMNAVRREAEGYLETHRARMANIEHMESTAKDLIAFLAVLFDVSAQEALDMATGRDREAA